jgi:hypothetical protein
MGLCGAVRQENVQLIPCLTANPQEPSDSTSGRILSMDTWIGIITGCVALVSLAVSFGSLRVARKAVRVTQTQAWDYLGGQQCAAYRTEVLRLYELGLGREEIKEWFRKERGGQENPYSHEGHETAYDAFAEGCGSVDELLDLLPPRRKAKAGMRPGESDSRPGLSH